MIFLFDAVRLVLALFIAESGLTIVNNSGGWHHGPPPPGRKGPRAGPSSEFRTPGFTFVANNLAVKFMDLFFGTAVILILYKALLLISYMVRVKFAEREKKLLAGDEIKDGLGCISGNYGYPIKKSWVAFQTLLLSLCIFTAKVMMYRVCSINVDTIHAIQQKTLSWAKPMNPLLRLFLLGLGVPFIFISSQLILLDYNLRYRYQRYDSFEWRNEPEEYQLIELSLGAVKDDDEERTLALDQPLIGTSSFTQGSSSSNNSNSSINLTEPVIEESFPPTVLAQDEPRQFTRANSLSSVESDDRSSSRSSTDMSSIYSVSSDIASSTSAGVVAGLHPNRMGMRYGVVTASLLNMAAVSATASMRPGLFGHINSAPESASESSESTDSIDGVDDDDELYEESGDLPSYDDSQRQQQALLKNTRLSAQQQALISELKR